MRPVSAASLARLLAGAEPATFRRFVASVWAVRGWETTTGNEVVVATNRLGLVQRLAIYQPRGPPDQSLPPEATAVVAATVGPKLPAVTGSPPVCVYDAQDVYEMLRYGMDRSDADRLLRRFFGRSMPRPRSSPARRDSRSWWTSTRSGVALAVTIGLAVLLITAPLLGGSPVGTLGATEPSAPGSPAAVETPRTTPTPMFQPVEGPVASPPPGIEPNGLVDTRMFREHTAAALANGSYRWQLTRRTTVDGAPTETVRTVVTVRRPDVYAATVRITNESGVPRTVVDGAYADGESYIERHAAAGETTYCARPVRDGRAAAAGYTASLERKLGWLLAARTSTLEGSARRDGRSFYRVELSSAQWSDIEHQTGHVVVDGEGRVHELQTRYVVSRSATRTTTITELHLDYDVNGVPRPPWSSVARAVTNATAARC